MKKLQQVHGVGRLTPVVAMKRPAPSPPTVPSLRAIPFLKTTADSIVRLTPRQREQLLQIGVRVRLPGRSVIYREGAQSDSVYVVADGAVKCYRHMPSGRRALCAFLFSRDLFGLSEDGHYVNTAQAVSDVTLYRLPLEELAHLLKQDGDLQFQFLSKITHELRESYRRTILVGRRDAAGRLAMFLALMANRIAPGSLDDGEIPLPMSRTDIADYLGLSVESVSRAAADLERREIAVLEGRHRARVVDRAKLIKLAAAI